MAKNVFSEEIILWYAHNKRDLPWRNTKNPYLIWLSEIILQQTRVEQGLPYYLQFAQKFPTVQQLAAANEDEVLKLWQGLGYYSRARNLHQSARWLTENLNGNFPDTYQELLKLKGVGDYTAAAIASFAYNLPHAVLDGNVFRLLSRYFGIGTAINTSAGHKEFSTLAASLLAGYPAGYLQSGYYGIWRITVQARYAQLPCLPTAGKLLRLCAPMPVELANKREAPKSKATLFTLY